MKRLLNRINIWLLMTCFKNKFFEKRVRWQLHSFINYILYPEFRSSWDMGKILYSNRYIFLISNTFLILLTSMFFFGRYTNYNRISELKENLYQKNLVVNKLADEVQLRDLKISNLSIELKSRGYIEYKVINESKIEYIDNLRSIPDSIFFLMVDEADKYGIPYVIFFRMMEKESKCQFIANSEGSGAFGYMQVVKSTFSKYYNKLDLENGHTEGNNIRVAANLISSIHSFWSNKFKDERTVWEYTLAEYGCGRAPMQDGNGGYFIPDSVKPGINYVMRCYKTKKSS